jgi:hypothetical protein
MDMSNCKHLVDGVYIVRCLGCGEELEIKASDTQAGEAVETVKCLPYTVIKQMDSFMINNFHMLCKEGCEDRAAQHLSDLFTGLEPIDSRRIARYFIDHPDDLVSLWAEWSSS